MADAAAQAVKVLPILLYVNELREQCSCLLYTSDAADE